MALSETNILFSSPDGLRLSGILHEPEHADPTRPWVVISHGMLSSKEGAKQPLLARALAQAGFYALRFDYRGQGESEGDAEHITLSGNAQDLTAACRLLLEKGAPSLVLLGSSMGAATSAVVGVRHPEWVRAFVFLSAMVHADLFARLLPTEQLVAWREHGTVPPSFPRPVRYDQLADAANHDIPACLASLPQPKLFVHGGRDELISVAMLRESYDRCRKPKTLELIAAADHAFGEEEHRDLLVQRVVQWLSRTTG